MRWLDEARTVGRLFKGLTFYEQFERAVVLVLTILTVAVVASATWHLCVTVFTLLVTEGVNPGDQLVFQSVFGMIFTVIIALEFKQSLLVVLGRQETIVRVRSIVLIAMLAVSRKFIILDLREADSANLFALATAILALAIVYWLVKDHGHRVAADISRDKS